MDDYNIHCSAPFSRAFWLAKHHQLYSGLGADIVMESIGSIWSLSSSAPFRRKSTLEFCDQGSQRFRLLVCSEVTAGQTLDLETELAHPLVRKLDLKPRAATAELRKLATMLTPKSAKAFIGHLLESSVVRAGREPPVCR
jgi:hypothetical protein